MRNGSINPKATALSNAVRAARMSQRKERLAAAAAANQYEIYCQKKAGGLYKQPTDTKLTAEAAEYRAKQLMDMNPGSVFVVVERAQ